MCDDSAMDDEAPFDGPDHPAGAAALTVSAAVALAGVFAPWLQSGSVQRSSFELFDLAERLGFASDGLFAWAVRPWPLVPLLLVAACVAAWYRRQTVAGALAGIGGLYVGGVVIGVTQAPDAGIIRTSWGLPLSGLGALALIGVAAWMLAISPANRRG